MWGCLFHSRKRQPFGLQYSVRKVVPMTTAELIKNLCKQQNISVAELARRIGQSRQNLYKKLR